MKILISVSVLLLVCCCLAAHAQENSYRFKPVTASDFDIQVPNADTGTSAVIIANTGSATFEGNAKGWFTVIYKKHSRIKILNKTGFDAATETVNLFTTDNHEDVLEDLQATTYNLDNGGLTATRLDNTSVFLEKKSGERSVEKFTLPGVHEGSIIDFSYTLKSYRDFTLQPWYFQGEYPCLYSEYQVSIPEFFQYVFLLQGYLPFTTDSTYLNFRSYQVVYNGSTGSSGWSKITFAGNAVNRRWIMKNVPALKEEPYTSTLKNYISKIQFQLSEYRYPHVPPKKVLSSWDIVAGELMKNEGFGAELDRPNPWLGDEIKLIIGPAASDLEKAKKLYRWVADNFTCTSAEGNVLLDNPLRTVFRNRFGTAAEINLLLIAMLRHESIKADPVLLSTRDHGYAPATYPIMDRYNHVVVRMLLSGKPYYFDASRSQLGFGRLPADCYNGLARVICTQPDSILFSTDSLVEKKTTSVLLTSSDNGRMEGKIQTTMGMLESINTRQYIKEKGEANYIKTVASDFGPDYPVMNLQVDSLHALDQPLQYHFNIKAEHGTEQLIYFNPVLITRFRSNLLRAAKRLYPVEMPSTINETYILHMDIPDGYVVDELPASARTTFNGNQGYFDYLIVKTDSNIQLRTSVVLKKANFDPDEYNALRDFFTFVVKKYSEQIVFKKK